MNKLINRYFAAKVVTTIFILPMTACNSANSIHSMAAAAVNIIEVTRLSPYRKIEYQWRGKSIVEFQNRYGPPTSQSENGDPIWRKTITAHIAGHDESSYTGPAGFRVTNIWFVPAHDAQVNCSVKIKIQENLISLLETTEDFAIMLDNAPFIHGQESACQRIFGF